MSKLTDHLNALPDDADLIREAVIFIGDTLDRIEARLVGEQPMTTVGETVRNGHITVDGPRVA